VYGDGKAEVTLLRIRILPKTELPLHQHPVINAGVLLKGQLTVVTQDNEMLYLKAGDTIVDAVNNWHSIISHTDPIWFFISYYPYNFDKALTLFSSAKI